MFSRSMTEVAITSLKGCCKNGLLPAFIRHRFPSISFHRFFKHPSEVLSGDWKSKSGFLPAFPNRTSPISSEKLFSKKLISCQETVLFSGFIQYWSERLNPKHFASSCLVFVSSSSSNAHRIPERVAGIERSSHHRFKAALSAIPFFAETPIGKCFGHRVSTILRMLPVVSSSSTLQTGIILCISIYFIDICLLS